MMTFIAKFIVLCHLAIQGITDRFLAFFYKKLMIKCGTNVSIKPSTSVIKGLENMILGNHVRIHRYATIFCTNSKLIIGNKVALGPKVTIMTGNHRTSDIGRFMWDVKEKIPGDDRDVILDDEIWVGANVTILSGVHIGRGCVVAAGAVVSKDLPSYSFAGGLPAKVLKFRFTIDEILEHERILYPMEKRYNREDLIKIREHYEQK